jgi:4-methyl-5(b-hydroxyethyl)-thiazole monophosphate biosynthesis
MAKKTLVLLAEGFEEVEAVTPVDYLRRAGVEVTVAAISESPGVKGSRGIIVMADTSLAELKRNGSFNPDSWDAVVLPGGGPGAKNLAASKDTGRLLGEMAKKGKLVCAICASPAVVLAPLGLLTGKNFTCYPGLEKEVTGANWSCEKVVVDGNIITSRGAGTAGLFAAAVISQLAGEEKAKEISDSVLL